MREERRKELCELLGLIEEDLLIELLPLGARVQAGPRFGVNCDLANVVWILPEH